MADGSQGIRRLLSQSRARIFKEPPFLIALHRVGKHVCRKIMNKPVRRNGGVIAVRMTINENSSVFSIISIGTAIVDELDEVIKVDVLRQRGGKLGWLRDQNCANPALLTKGSDDEGE